MVCQAPKGLLASQALRVPRELLALMAQMVSLVHQGLMGHLETEAVPACLGPMVPLVSEGHKVPRVRGESRANLGKWAILALLDYRGPQVLLVRGEREESQGHLAPLDPQVLEAEKETRDRLGSLDKWEYLELLGLRALLANLVLLDQLETEESEE